MIEKEKTNAEIQNEWLKKHQKADLMSIGPKPHNIPSIAVYVNPIWRDRVNTECLEKAIFNAIQYYLQDF